MCKKRKEDVDLRENLIVLSAPSATGKDTVYACLKEKLPQIRRAITATTREKRSEDVDGVNYFFHTEAEFLRRAAAGDFAEHNHYDSGYYGTPREQIEACPTDIPLFLIIDTNGMRQIKKKYPNTKTVFLLPPSMEELERRIRARKENTEEEIKNRLAIAKEEIKKAPLYDHVLVNDVLEKCVAEVMRIVCEK